jgi:predicted O-methyltransferase YrrM
MSGYGWEMEQVVREVRRAETILEIGTHRGGSLRVWRREFDPILLIGVDPSDEDTGAGWTTPAVADLLDVKMVRLPSQAIEALYAVQQILDGRAVDLLFIDGDHTPQAVETDWAMYSHLVSPDGVIVLDDAARTDTEGDSGPRLLYERLRKTHRTKLIYDGHGGTGLAMIWP